MGTRRHYRRSDLFLVRLWRRDNDDRSNAGKESGQVQWHGKVQRVMDGEAYQFRSLQGLVDLLLILLANDREGE